MLAESSVGFESYLGDSVTHNHDWQGESLYEYLHNA